MATFNTINSVTTVRTLYKTRARIVVIEYRMRIRYTSTWHALRQICKTVCEDWAREAHPFLSTIFGYTWHMVGQVFVIGTSQLSFFIRHILWDSMCRTNKHLAFGYVVSYTPRALLRCSSTVPKVVWLLFWSNDVCCLRLRYLRSLGFIQDMCYYQCVGRMKCMVQYTECYPPPTLWFHINRGVFKYNLT